MATEFHTIQADVGAAGMKKRAEEVLVHPESLIKPTMTEADWQKVHQAKAVKDAIAYIMGPNMGPWNQ